MHILNFEFKNASKSEPVAQNNVHLKKGESGRSPMLYIRNRCSNFYNEVKEYFPSPKVSGKEFETDGTMSVCINDQQVHIINWEFKNELGSGGSDAVAQNNAYFVHLKKGESGRSPMLLVSVVGCHYFQVFGAAWNGGVVCVDPLCPPVSLLYVPHDPTSGILKTARVLAAMHFTVSKLTDYYSPQEDKQPQGPYFNSSGDLKSIKQFGESTRMFEAKLFDEDVIVVGHCHGKSKRFKAFSVSKPRREKGF